MVLRADDSAAQHVVRTLRALELLADGPQTQAGLARELMVHRRTARRLLARLVEEGYAEATRRGRHVAYAATPRLAVLGRQVADGLDLVAIGRRHLAALDGGLFGARFIALLDGVDVWLVHVEELQPGEVSEEPLARRGPLYATAAGKVFLSADDVLAGNVLNQELLAFTARTLATRADLLLELAKVRAQGYAVEDGEHRAGARAVASGVVNHVGATVLAVGAVPLPGAKLDELGSVVRSAALAFSHAIGAAIA
jgi:DNA-binding IclR family transcriptional regulator